jgi:competence protein ComEC
MLLAILGGVVLALFGVGPRARLVGILVLIAAYVPLAGAGPSIQRAGVMGAAGILAGLVGRPADRAYLPLLAAVATLLLNPLSAAEIGWQLSFAAVIGIALWSAPIRALLAPRLLAAHLPERLAGPLAEGAALTLAATVATAPLMALHFEAVSLASLPANLLALPAVAPVMWLGMLAALLGQLPLLPTAPLGLLEGPLLDYIALIADRFSRPGWAVIRPPAPSPWAVLAIYLGLLGGLGAAIAALRRRGGVTLARPLRLLVAVGATVVGAAATLSAGAPSGEAVARDSLRVTALDVGQGDAILLDGPGLPAILLDAGPPGAGIAELLRAQGVKRLAAVFITHDQLDHTGGLPEVLRALEVGRLVVARPAPEPAARAAAVGTRIERVSEGEELRFDELRLQVLAPRASEPPAADLNQDSLVIAARFAGWSTLLTGDAEAETSRIDPGPFDLLKLAHHGSADAGLGRLLDRSAPRVALIAVGKGNPHGHPTEGTLQQLAERDVCVLRTDLDGNVWAELGPGGLVVGSERGDLAGRRGCRWVPR